MARLTLHSLLVLLPFLKLLGQVHTHPLGRQPDPRLLVHTHAGVVALQQSDVFPLRLEIGKELLGFGDGGFVNGGASAGGGGGGGG